ncbi:hypothetical protein BGZ94_006508 [Podila epigama]|nr:hypothetical protein BGZ94_006508 [Podila epigama]
MKDLDHIRQGNSTVAEYTVRFQRIARLISDLPESLRVYRFLNGLHPKIRLETQLRTPETMQQAIHQASLVWSIVFQDKPPTVESSGSTSMELNNMGAEHDAHSCCHIHNFNNNRNNHHHSAGRGSFRQPRNATRNMIGRTGPRVYTSLATGAERARLTDARACWWCRKPGHNYGDCTLYQRHLHAIEVQGDDDKGKALDEE